MLRIHVCTLVAALLLVLGGVTVNVRGAGIATHQEIAEQTVPAVDATNYPGLLNVLTAHRGAVESGCVHPDAYYALSYLFPERAAFYRGAASLAHGRQGGVFNAAALDYLRAQGFPPSSREQGRGVAFFLGNRIHQSSDDAWHPGFCAAAEDQDQTTEDLIELAVDFFCMWEREERWERVWWFVPTEAVAGVFTACEHPVSEEDIHLGMSLIVTARFVERVLGPVPYLVLAHRLPWTRANYLDYPDGGVVDCAARSSVDCEFFWDALAGRAAIDAAPVFTTGSAHIPNEAFLRTAVDLLVERAVNVPYRCTRGGIILLPPRVRNARAVDRIIERRLGRLRDSRLRTTSAR